MRGAAPRPLEFDEALPGYLLDLLIPVEFISSF